MDEIVAVIVIAAAALTLFAFAALQVAHRFTDHRIDARLRVAVLSELDQAPPETVAGPALALAVVSQLPIASLLLHGSISVPSDFVLIAELALAGTIGLHLAGGPSLGRRLALRYSRALKAARGS